MKTKARITILLLIFTLILFFMSICDAKNDSLKNIYLAKSIRYTHAFISGYSEGADNTILYHYQNFKRVHPNCSNQFWNPSISWKNKYEYNDPTKKEKFFLSKSSLVMFTDGWHLLKGINRFSTIGTYLIIPIGGKKSFKWYIREILIGYGINRVGFYTSYNLIYK